MATGAGGRTILEIDDYLPAYITFIANKWSRSASRLYLARFGIGIEAWRIMALLAIEGRLTAQRVVNVIHMDKASVSRNFKSMHGGGLIALEDDPNDARQRFATLTKAGLAIHDEIVVLALEREKMLLVGIEAEERRTLLRLLGRVNANLSRLDEEGGETGSAGTRAGHGVVVRRF